MSTSEEHDEDILKPTVDEVEGRIAFHERQIGMWRGTPGYIRTLKIELCALRMLRDYLVETIS
jgi:hypothetical protein